MRPFHCIAALAAALSFCSCSDDPVGPGGGGSPVTYQASVEFFGSEVVSLWGSGSGDVYASGRSIMRYDGQSWEPLVLPNADSGWLRTWGATNGDLYAMGSSEIHRYDGSQWHRIARPASVRDVWGSDNGEIFVVGGSNHRLYHYDGTGWFVDSLQTDGSWDRWHIVSGGGPNDVYIGGYGGWLGHFDGQGWQATRVSGTHDFSSIWKAPDGPLYISTYDTLFTYDGVALTPVDLGADIRSYQVSGQSASDVYCLGDPNYFGSSVLRYDGVEWSHVVDIEDNVYTVWGDRSSNRLFAGGENVVWEVEGATAAQSLGLGDSYGYGFSDLWGSEDDGVYLVGSRAYRYHEGTWSDLKKQDLTETPAYSIWGRTGKELYAVGPGLILHYDGVSWTAVSGAGNRTLNAVAGNRKVVFAVGNNGAILRHDGNAWTPMASGTNYDLYAVYAWENGAFAGGEDGALMRYDGREWRPYPSPVNWNILDMVGFGSNRIFASGSNSAEICTFNGRTWTPIFIGYTRGSNYSIWGTSERDLFLGQGRGDVLHFDGNEWSYLPRITTSVVRSVWGAPGGQLIAASDGGVIRYHR